MSEKQIYRFDNEIDSVEVISQGAKIMITRNDGDGICAEYENPFGKPEFCAVLNEKKLTLKENFSIKRLVPRAAENYTIQVFLPEKLFNELKIKTASGGVEAEKVTAKNFTLDTASGNITIDSFFENVKIMTASGKVYLHNPTDKTAQSVFVQTASGTVEVSGYGAESFSIKSVSGRTSFDGASGAGKVSVASGAVRVKYAEWNGDLDINAASGKVEIGLPEGSGMELQFNGASGVLRTDIGNKGSFMNLGRGTNGSFGGENRHKIKAAIASGKITIAQI